MGLFDELLKFEAFKQERKRELEDLRAEVERLNPPRRRITDDHVQRIRSSYPSNRQGRRAADRTLRKLGK